jgi:arabinogalactan oligomer/maltooligosaccharide transport system permease protein
MFNVIYLVSAGKPNNATNILVTDAYRWAFERNERYGMAAAYGTIIFLILLLWTVFGTRIVRRKEDE